jgi:hypothetical protein
MHARHNPGPGPSTLLNTNHACPSQSRPWTFNIISRGSFCVQCIDVRAGCYFVDIGGIVDHQCLNLLSRTKDNNQK